MAAIITSSWGVRFANAIEISVDYYNWLNQRQPVFTRQLTEYEMEQIFGNNPNYIKNIGINDGYEWQKVEVKKK